MARCMSLGCMEQAVSKGLCKACAPSEKRKPKYGKDHYNTSAWKRMRKAHLSSSPLCLRCKSLGYITMADSVDHVISHEGDWEKFIDSSNFQSLCRSCHSIKTNKERSGVYEDYR